MKTKQNDHPSIPFLKAIFQNCDSDGLIDLRFISKPDDILEIFIPLAEVQSVPDAIEKYSNKRKYPPNSFFGVALRKLRPGGGDGTKGGITQIPALWCDIDFKNVPKEIFNQKYKDFPLRASIIVNSGGGYHLYWILKEPGTQEDIPRTENVLRRLATYFDGDLNCTDASRIMRIPGTFNYKYATPRTVTIGHLHPDNQYSLDDFEGILPAEETSSSTNDTGRVQEAVSERLQKIMECSFLQHCNKDSGDLPEPHWYAMVGVLAREVGGVDLIHSLSQGYPKYNRKETDAKILHALKDSGPMTCQKIKNKIKFDCGNDCGVKSPVSLAWAKKEAPDRETTTEHTKTKADSESLKLTYPTSHLEGFDLVYNCLGLLGTDYIKIAKVCWYYLFGQASREVVQFGKIKMDLRFPVAFILPSGHGKLNIATLIDNAGKGMGDHVSNPTSYHPEQLIGKVLRIEKGKGQVQYRQVRGHFDSDTVIFDDGVDLIQSKDPVYKESRRYLCKCLDVIGDNLMTKKPVDIPKEEALKYYPKCSVVIFFQPFPLPEECFLDGVFRRFPIIYMDFKDRNFDREFAQRLEDYSCDQDLLALSGFLTDVKSETLRRPLSFADDFAETFKRTHLLAIKYGRAFGPRASNFTRMLGFTLQNWLLKMAVIQARSNGRSEVTGWDVEKAFVDLIEILNSTFYFIERKVQGTLDYGEGWSGARGYDQQLLEWLALMGAKSEETSSVTIERYQKQIQEVTGYTERGARKWYDRHKKMGWIGSSQRKQTTRVWLTFSPPEDAPPMGDMGATVTQAYMEIIGRIQEEKKGGGARVTVSSMSSKRYPGGKDDNFTN